MKKEYMSSNLIEKRQIRIFISSTFRDMQAERDYLVQNVFPSLRRYCAERDVALQELDLRWGISEEESKQGKVVDICLTEIGNTHPFFIGLLGERYGWVPNKKELKDIAKNSNVFNDYPWVKDKILEGTSITEIEIQDGVLRSKEKVYAYFYFRSPAVGISEEFKEKPGSDGFVKLQRLKQDLLNQKNYPVLEYKSIEDLGAKVETDFKALVNTLFPEGDISELEKERVEQRAFLKSKTAMYVPIPELYKRLDEFVESEERSLIITGDSGMGKSALLANWIQKRGKQDDEKIIYHFIGQTGSQGDYHKIIEYLIEEICNLYSIPAAALKDQHVFNDVEQKQNREEKQRKELQNLIHLIKNKGRLVIILDGLDKLMDSKAKLLNWLPVFPGNVKLLVAAKNDYSMTDYFSRINYEILDMPVLDEKRREKLIEIYLNSFRKKLKPEQVKRIAKDKESANPLALRTLLDELRMFGKFEELDAEIERYLKIDGISALFDLVLERLEKISLGKKEFLRDALSVLYVSRNGLTEDEILKLTGNPIEKKRLDIDNPAPMIYWSQLFNGLANHLTILGGNVTFSNGYIRDAVKNRYLPQKENEMPYRRIIVNYLQIWEKTGKGFLGLERIVSESRRYKELPYQLFEGGVWDVLYILLAEFQTLEFLLMNDMDQLAKYWHALRKADKDKYAIEKYLDSEDNLSANWVDTGACYVDLSLFAKEKLQDQPLAGAFGKKAAEILAERIRNTPDDVAAFYNLGMLYGSIGEYENAIAALTEAIRLNPDSAASYSERGIIRLHMHEYDMAIADQTEAIRINPNRAMTFNNRGLAYDAKGEYNRAITDFTKAIHLNPDFYGAYYNRGNVFYKTDDNNEAINDFTEAIRLDPNSDASWRTRGNAWRNKGRHDKAIEDYTEALHLNPNDASTYYDRGNCHYSNGEYDRAIADYGEVIRLKPDEYRAYDNRGVAYYTKGDYDKAVSDYTDAIKLNPNEAELYKKRGLAYDKKGYYDLAIADDTDAIRLKPDYAGVYYNRGDAHFKKGDFDNAITDYTKAIKIRPDYAMAYNNRGYYYYSKGETVLAITDYDEALRIDPNLAIAYYNRGIAHQAAGGYELSITDFTNVLKREPNNSMAYYYRGTAYAVIRDQARFMADWEAALKIDPNNAQIKAFLDTAGKNG